MKEGKPLAEDLRFVIGLDSQSLSGVDWPETLLQFAQDICVHGITSFKISTAFPSDHQAVPDRFLPSGKDLGLLSNMAHLHAGEYKAGAARKHRLRLE
jgi:hypothetical protein